jgi:prepilin-type N-terminal cleavage/methylation domain-containing protein
MIKKNSGFTLIELLIVIALLGALAVGLLATVDPFEQLKKGTDTSRRNTTTEVYNSMIRYYAVKNSFPWQTALASPINLNNTQMSGWIGEVANAGELKADFLKLAGADNLGKIYVDSQVSGGSTVANTVSVCFEPESKSFRLEGNAKYDSRGSEMTGCLSQTSAGSACFWCIR